MAELLPYIIETDPKKDIFTNIEDNILREDSFLYRDVEFVLRQELTEPRYYFSILLSIAKGNHRIGLIANDTGLSISIVNKYLSILSDLQLVYRMVPVTESYKSRKGMHFLADNLFDFWNRFVYPAMEEIEKGRGRMVAEGIKPQFNQYVGKHFEAIVQEILEVLNKRELLPFRFTKIGKWWHKEKKIDVIALNKKIRMLSSTSVNGVIMSTLPKLSGISGERLGSSRLKARGNSIWSLRRVSGREQKKRVLFCMILRIWSGCLWCNRVCGRVRDCCAATESNKRPRPHIARPRRRYLL